MNRSSGEWIPHDINKGHLDYVFYLISFLCLINLAIYVFVSKSYVYRDAGVEHGKYTFLFLFWCFFLGDFCLDAFHIADQSKVKDTQPLLKNEQRKNSD